MKSIIIRGKKLELPAFFPDATRGYIRNVSSSELKKENVQGVVVNAYHLLKEDLVRKIKKIGIHKYMKLDIPIISDSGGFQVMSLIHKNPKLGKIYENKIIFNLDGKKIVLTPECCIKLQIDIKSDIVMCLDDCNFAEASFLEQEKAVYRTIKWAKKCKKEFLKLTKNMNENEKPLLFAIIQGGESKKLRKLCSQELIKIGFDGYAFGGFPIKNAKLLKNILKYVSDFIPENKLKYAMGIGKPEDIIYCSKIGYNLFDCVIPTRDARHKRLYILGSKIKTLSIRGKHENNKNPISKKCNCYCCKNYSLSDLYYLFKEKDEKALKLASIHNLRTYSDLMKNIGKSKAL